VARPSPLPLVAYAYEAYKYQLRWRAALAAVRGAGKSLRFGWTHRRGAAPLYAAAGLAVLGSLLASAEGGAGTGTVIAALAGCGVWQRLHGRRRGKVSRRRAVAVWAVWTAASVWLIAAAAHGLRPPMPGLLLVLTLAAGVPWWWHHRIRPVPGVEDWQQVWDERVAAQGSRLPGSQLAGRAPVEAGWEATIELPPGKLTTTAAVAATESIASAYRVPVSSVVIEPTDTGDASRARLLMLERNPLEKLQPWAGPALFDLAMGVVPVGVYPDGQVAYYRFWRPESGAVHSLVAGTTGAGKSRFVEMLLACERHSRGLICSWVCDPQGGQSLPDWIDHVDYAERTAEGGVRMLRRAVAVMYERNAYLAQVEWTDDRGRVRKGKAHFEPTPEMPLLSITIEEAHAVLSIAEARKLAEDIAKMGRKCGVSLRLVVQVPLLDQLGNSMTLRDGVAGGNVVVFRTANRLSGQVAFNGTLPVDPSQLPRQFPDGSSTAGLGYILGASDRQAIMRSFCDLDPFSWATSGDTVRLSPVLEEAPAPADPVPAPVASGTDAIVAFLRRHGDAHTGVIAEAVGMPRGTVSTLLTRLKDRGLVRQVRHGVWAAAASEAA
jgi:hypothetical protein